MWEVVNITRGHYSPIADVITKMNEVVDKDDRFKDDVQFSFDSLNRKVTVLLQHGRELYLSDIGQMLRFSSNSPISSTSITGREVDLEQGFHDFFVYCDIVQSPFVGDVLVPLLRLELVESNDGQCVRMSFERLLYLPVSRRELIYKVRH